MIQKTEEQIQAEEAAKAEAIAKEGEDKKDPLEGLLNELNISDQNKQLLRDLFNGIGGGIKLLNDRISTLESRPAQVQDTTPLDDLTPEQKYEILMARAQAPVAEANTQMWQSLLSRASGGGGGSSTGLEGLLNNAKQLEALRSILVPAPSPVMQAMERAQVAQIIAQTRLMNKVAGKETSDYLDKLEGALGGPGSEEE